jgi:hypothetical protein
LGQPSIRHHPFGRATARELTVGDIANNGVSISGGNIAGQSFSTAVLNFTNVPAIAVIQSFRVGIVGAGDGSLSSFVFDGSAESDGQLNLTDVGSLTIGSDLRIGEVDIVRLEISGVPEPATAMLLTLGALVAAPRRRRAARRRCRQCRYFISAVSIAG